MRESDYPLSENARDRIRSRTGRALGDLTLENIRAGNVTQGDLSIDGDTLREQAVIAEEAGFAQLASNLRRAAELVAMPDEKMLSIYEALRPYRLSYDALLALAQEIEETYGAVENARLIREAAAVYRERGLV